MIDYVEDALALDEAYLTRAIAQEVFGMDKLAPESINADGGVAIWISDEQERAVLTGEYSRSMDAALGLLRSIGNQLNPDRRLRLLRSTATYLGQVLAVSDGDAGDVLLEVVATLTPFQVAQAFLAAWRDEVENYGTLPYLSEAFLLDID